MSDLSEGRNMRCDYDFIYLDIIYLARYVLYISRMLRICPAREVTQGEQQSTASGSRGWQLRSLIIIMFAPKTF